MRVLRISHRRVFVCVKADVNFNSGIKSEGLRSCPCPPSIRKVGERRDGMKAKEESKAVAIAKQRISVGNLIVQASSRR